LSNRNIRSNSILFFPARYVPIRGLPGPDPNFPQALGYHDPLFVGLGNARVDDVLQDPGPRYYGEEPSKHATNINLDYYQHPDKRRDPTLRYSRSYDIYSLGCLLLEIGYWKPLHHLVEVGVNPDATKKLLLALAVKLDGLVSRIKLLQ
jgi:hypothetical protein